MVCLKKLITTVPLLVSATLGAPTYDNNDYTTSVGGLYNEVDGTETETSATYTYGDVYNDVASSSTSTSTSTSTSSALSSASSSATSQVTRVSAQSPSPVTTLATIETDSTSSVTVVAGSATTTSDIISSFLTKITSTLSPAAAPVPSGSVSDVSELTTKTGKTSTSVIYSQTSSEAPISSLTGTIISASVATTQSQPLMSSSFSSSAQTVTMSTQTLTADVTVSSPSPTGTDRTTLTLVAASEVAESYVTTYTSESVSTILSVSTYTTNSVYYNNRSATVLSPSDSSSSSSSAPQTVVSTKTSLSTSSVAVTSTTVSKVVSSVTSTTVIATSALSTVNLFEAIETSSPTSKFSSIENKWSFNDNVNSDSPTHGQTNKFFSNLLLDEQENPAFAYPYIVWQISSTFFGFAVQHTSSSGYTFAQYMDNGAPRVFTNPLNQADIVFSSTSFSSSSDFSLSVSDLNPGSVLATVESSSNGGSNYIDIPIVHGMGFSTAIYHGDLVLRLDSGMNIQTITAETSEDIASGVSKYRITINNVDWLLYVTNPSSTEFSLSTEYSSTTGTSIVGNTAIDGLIVQVCVAPDSSDLEVYYDQAAGMYVTSYTMSGSSDGITATYSYDYATSGASASGNTMIFVLPHQLSVLDTATSDANTGITTAALVKGMATGFLTTSIGCAEALNTEISWLPWTSQLGSKDLTYSSAQIQKLAEVANSELSVNIKDSITGINSYWLGKIIDRFAYILLTVSEIIQDSDYTTTALDGMKEAFELIFEGENEFPFVYDSKFGGIISNSDWSSITETADDYGNSHYNDHHFHYGYIVHAAAVVGYIDKKQGGTWAEDNKDYISALVRDVANPSSDDTFFPVSRYFDWFDGHSWASGLYYDPNGNDEESTSEDFNFLYGMKMWGTVIGDTSMQYRADLMIKIMSRSLDNYFYFKDDNDVVPSEMLPNKVAGITFENFMDYSTYFGLNTEYIHGIHMLPMSPVSSQMRSAEFVEQEWTGMLESIIGDVDSGWKGILNLNQALYDPASSYAFFNTDNFNSAYLDDGMSLTWSLAFSGGIANSLGLLN